jgi:hypothetical protein
MLIGFPWDTKKIISEEIKLFKSRMHLIKATHVSVLLPMPGTEYYEDYPLVHEWYLNDSFFKSYETYFAQVLNIYMGPDSLKLNQYEFSEETLGEIKNIYYSNLIKSYFKKSSGFDNRPLFLILQTLDALLASISFLTFNVSSSLEKALFQKLKSIRFLLGTKLAANQVAKNG